MCGRGPNGQSIGVNFKHPERVLRKILVISGLPVAFLQIVTESMTLCTRLRLFPGKAGKPFLS